MARGEPSFLCFSALISVLLFSKAGADVTVTVFEDTIYYDGRLQQLPEMYRFSFHVANKRISFPPEGGAVRLWGIDNVSASVPTAILDRVWRCRVVGAPLKDMKAGALALICELDGENLAQKVVSLGYATENCAESFNAFGTCSAGESK